MVSVRHHRRVPLGHAKPTRLDAVRNEINVTPLVDVVLVLLIIFMVVAPELMRGMEVNLPRAKNFNEQRDTGDQLIVSLVQDGGRVKHYFDRDLVADENALRQRVAESLTRKRRRIFLKADADLPFLQVYPTLMAIHEAGSPGVELGIEELKDK